VHHSPGRRMSHKAVELLAVNGAMWLAGFCNRAIKRPALSHIQPMTRSSPLVVSRMAVADSTPAVRLRKLHFGYESYITQVTLRVIRRDGPDHCTEVDWHVTFG